MKSGKLNWDDLKSIIDNSRGKIKEDVKIHGGIGEDCSVINFGDYDCVLSTDPITGAGKNVGRLAVNINCNDIASSGVSPLGIMVTILAPEGSRLEDIKEVMNEIGEEANKLDIEVIGGHTEVTSAVNRMVVSCTVIGKCKAGSAVATAGAQLGDDIVVTKQLGLEGTSIIVSDKEELVKSFLKDDEINEAKSYLELLSVVSEGKIAGKYGVNSMHDITEGGVLGALWEMAEASGVGFKVYEDKMPVSKVTKKIGSYFKIDPLRLISSGSMLITANNGEKLVSNLKENGINAAVIGKVTESKGILVKQEEESEVAPPERDELFNI